MYMYVHVYIHVHCTCMYMYNINYNVPMIPPTSKLVDNKLAFLLDSLCPPIAKKTEIYMYSRI